MGAALLELEQSLRSQKEYLTAQEADLLQVCKNSAIRAFTFSSLVGGATAWGATWKLSRILRVNISGGAAAVMGFWGFGRALETCVDHILSRDGSRLQRELANIMVMRHLHVPWARRLLNKRFYMETVFDDSSQARIRWRLRNYFGDGVPFDREPQSSTNHKGSEDQKALGNESRTESDIKKTAGLEAKQVIASPLMYAQSRSGEITEDPFDSIFGTVGAPLEEILHPAATPAAAAATTRAHHRSHRRAHRNRRKMRHHEAASV